MQKKRKKKVIWEKKRKKTKNRVKVMKKIQKQKKNTINYCIVCGKIVIFPYHLEYC